MNKNKGNYMSLDQSDSTTAQKVRQRRRPKTPKQKALIRWATINKKFSKLPIVSEDMKMMHDFYGVRDAMKHDPEWLKELLTFRFKFLQEELTEGMKAIDTSEPDEIVDSLIDLVVVAVGTLDLFDVDFKKSWYRVLAANMNKTPGIKESRPNPLGLPDLIKPPSWEAPTHLDNIGLLNKIFPTNLR